MAAHGEVEEMARIDFGHLSPDETACRWREGLFELIAHLPAGQRKQLAAIAIDGTSGSVLACDPELQPLFAPLLYDDARAAPEATAIAARTGADHPAASATSGLAKALWLRQRVNAALFLNQAEWLATLLGAPPASDSHNGLKMGLDPVGNQWPAWLAELLPTRLLPRPVRPGAPLGLIGREHASALGLPSDCLLRAGTTDSIAAFLAAGTEQPGEAVTSLGTTLVLKLLSRRRVESGAYGIYSHWFGELWLTGGASNSGGGVLRAFFSDAELASLSASIDPSRDSGLDYYPLNQPGERFPINDPQLPPRLAPQPADRGTFLHGLLEGLARIEALGYRRLAELGADPLLRVVSCGGGARNSTYSSLRQRVLRVPVGQAARDEACYGSARLACRGTDLFIAEQTR
jgi:sugar (pentulose or hexulose) kinase